MAANNFFSYGQPAYAAAAYPTAAAAVASPATVAGVQASNAAAAAAAAAAAGYVQAQQAAVVSAAPTASYRPANSAGVVTYTAFQAPQVTASYGASPSYHQTNSYQAQYPTQISATPVHSYVGGKASTAYYATQPACVAPPVTYTVSDPHYQARPVYTTTSNVTLTHGAPVANVRPPPPVSAAGTAMAAAAAAAAAAAVAARVPRPPTYTYATTYAVQSSPAYTYTAHSIPQQQKATIFTQAPPTVIATGSPATAVDAATLAAMYPTQALATQQWTRKPQAHTTGARPPKPRPAPKPPQLHYCEVCKISCAGPQTYKEHLEGQKHKKKEAAQAAAAANATSGQTGTGNGNASSAPNQPRSGNALRCELCDVTCTGSDAYAAHIRGSKHQKVMKLHAILGKPIPSMEPTVLTENTDAAVNSDRKVVRVAAPKKEFRSCDVISVPSGADELHQEVSIPLLPEERDVQPVGADYIEEVKSDDGKLISFNCKLCDCKFNDPNAKEMHMKGRRHRLQYKKKVNPDLVVDIKPTARQRKMAEERAKRTMVREDFWRRREEEFRQMEEEERAYWQERRMFEDEFPPDYHPDMMRHFGGAGNAPPGPRMRGFGGGGGGGAPVPMMPPGFFGPPMMRRPETIDDRHVMAKHSDIYPGDDVLAAIQKHVSLVEKALKSVSDTIGNIGDKNGAGINGTMIDKPGDRLLKGVMRVGVLAKGLLLKGDTRIQLVLLCSQHPTVELLQRVVAMLPTHLSNPDGVKYEVIAKIADALVVVNVKDATKLEIEVTLTSPALRESADGGSASLSSPNNALNKDKCLEALASLRQAKWFQARAASRQSCVMIIRILKDLCSRETAWKPMKLFLLELLTERVLASAPVPLPPGDALRRIFEAISGGILLPDSPGFLDPCEKVPRDVAEGLTPQERERLTSSAQSFLRLMAFRKVNVVLQMDPLPQRFQRSKVPGSGIGRKRGPDDNDDDESDAAKQIKLENDNGDGASTQ